MILAGITIGSAHISTVALIVILVFGIPIALTLLWYAILALIFLVTIALAAPVALWQKATRRG